MTAKKDRSTPEGARLWAAAEAAAREVATWPAWKRGHAPPPKPPEVPDGPGV